ncbi:MAG: M3 family oligoendopeptidase [Candidatus Absconditabacterales bacterium]
MKSNILPSDFVLRTWDDIQPYYENILTLSVTTVEDLQTLIANSCDLDDYLSEDYARRYIKQSCNTSDESAIKHYEEFVDGIQPQRTRMGDKVNKLIASSPCAEQLPQPYPLLLRGIRRSIELFREENIPLEQEADKLSREYVQIVSKMTIQHDGKELTMKQASQLLKEEDRVVRKEIFDKMMAKRQESKDQINIILDKLIVIRNQIAKNCGFKNYAEYKHFALQRFDYSLDDVNVFHAAVAQIITPLNKAIADHREGRLGHPLKPYDFAVSVYDKTTNECYKDPDDLVTKTVVALNKTHPDFGGFVQRLHTLKQLDLGTRKGKMPGGYNYPLSTGDSSFIFMNASTDDYGVFTMLHESGHALHHYYTYDIKPSALRHPGSEVCEIASMAQELLSLDKLAAFFQNPKDYDITILEKLEDDILVFPWISKVDLFQQWLYTNPEHTHEQRADKRSELSEIYPYCSGIGSYDAWAGEYEQALACRWQNQIHVFEYPLYYIEYAIAGLAAIAMRKNYLENPHQGVEDYINLLKVGNTKPMPKIFEAGGLKFDFSKEYVQNLMDFMQSKLQECYAKIG